MPRTALILGASGRFGRNAVTAFEAHGWTVRRYTRGGDQSLTDAAQGAEVIINGWNPPYPAWAAQVPAYTAEIIAAAEASGASVMMPGNVYVFGAGMPPVIGPGVPHAAQNTLGRIRVEMEAAYRASGVKTVILRAGDFLDTEASGNWFDRIIAPKARQGKLTYPGATDQPHAWAYLPDLAESFARLADQLDTLPVFNDLAFAGYTLTGAQLTQAVETAMERPMRVTQMSWLPIRLAQPFWPVAKHLIEMRYLWSVPHQLDGNALRVVLPNVPHTALETAIKRALEL